MVWNRGGINLALQRESPTPEQVEARRANNLGIVLPKKTSVLPPSLKERLQSHIAAGNERENAVMANYSKFPDFSDKTDYLEAAEQMAFDVANVKNRAAQIRQRKAIPKLIPGELIVKQGGQVVGPGGLITTPKGVPQGDVTSSSSNTMPKMTPKQMSKYEAAIIAGKSHAAALKAAGVAPVAQKGMPNVKPSARPLQMKAPGGTASGPLKPGDVKFKDFVNAMGMKESGGNYGATNPSGASGKYQILRSNFEGPGGWDRETIGREVSYNEYMNSPKIQEAIARGKLKQYFNQYGPMGAASAWYSGQPGAWKTSMNAQGDYPSIHNYVVDVMSKLGIKIR